MRTIVYPYKLGSKSARLLSESLTATRVRPVGRYTPRSGDFIVNWGASTVPGWYEAYTAFKRLGNIKMLNEPEAVAKASNKLTTFRILRDAGIRVPEFTPDRIVAGNWNGRRPIYCRHKLQGHSGDGIEVISDPDTMLPNAPLYVRGIHNHGEYRVHVVDGDVISYTKKRKRRGADTEDLIRNLDTGWVYTRNNLRRLDRVEDLAIDAVNALGLDFGAVDIIMNEDGDVFVLEVNTACGLGDTTLNDYVEAFNRLRR